MIEHLFTYLHSEQFFWSLFITLLAICIIITVIQGKSCEDRDTSYRMQRYEACLEQCEGSVIQVDLEQCLCASPK